MSEGLCLSLCFVAGYTLIRSIPYWLKIYRLKREFKDELEKQGLSGAVFHGSGCHELTEIVQADCYSDALEKSRYQQYDVFENGGVVKDVVGRNVAPNRWKLTYLIEPSDYQYF